MIASRKLRVEDADESRRVLLAALDNVAGPAREIVVFNAGVALYTAKSGRSDRRRHLAVRQIIVSGAARAKLDEFVATTRRLAA